MSENFDLDPNRGRGLIERDFSKNPVGYCSKPFSLSLIPWDEMEDRWQIQKKEEATLRDLIDANGIEALNQGSTSYCWAYSSTGATMVQCVAQGQKYVPLSGTSVAYVIKGGKNQGGWCSQSLEFIADKGVVPISDWPEGQDGRQSHFNNPVAWEKGAQYKVTEWMDLEPRNMQQLLTCLLCGIPVATDYNWWGHSILTHTITALKIQSNKLKDVELEYMNSWGSGWGEKGHGRNRGNKAYPDGAIAPFVAIGS